MAEDFVGNLHENSFKAKTTTEKKTKSLKNAKTLELFCSRLYQQLHNQDFWS